MYKYILVINGFYKTKYEHFLTKRVNFANTNLHILDQIWSDVYWRFFISHYLPSTIATHIPTLLFTTSATTTTNHRMLRVFAKSTLLVKKCSRLVLKKPFIPRIYLYTMAIRHYFLIVIRSTHVMLCTRSLR